MLLHIRVCVPLFTSKFFEPTVVKGNFRCCSGVAGCVTQPCVKQEQLWSAPEGSAGAGDARGVTAASRTSYTSSAINKEQDSNQPEHQSSGIQKVQIMKSFLLGLVTVFFRH